ncbi:hypothetical protein CJ030_MR7G002278 [Morella rubra]|uniref:Uncharacterized protein n=1 Tax=Morella rubra TaxID=262757 RepID=A0A6A1V1Q3_9ROSI|nr:hypothetical protein CJ030_MR7G002278 [Morella rubra]
MPKCSRLAASSHMVMFRCQLVVERSVSTLDFYDYNFEGRTIHQILIHQAWECVFSWIGQPYTLLVQKFYSALQEVDIDTDKWKAIICGVQVRISPDILSHYLGIQRRLGLSYCRALCDNAI